MGVILFHQRVRVGAFLRGEVVEFHELGAVNRQFQVEDVVVAGVETYTACLGLVEVGIYAEHDLAVEYQHLGLVLGDVGLQFATDFAGEIARHLVHQLTHDVGDFVCGVRRCEVVTAHTHVQQVAFIQLHGSLGREVDDHQTGESSVKQHKAANVRAQAGFGDALHHGRIVNLTVRCLTQNMGDRVAQTDQKVFGVVAHRVGGVVHGVV